MRLTSDTWEALICRVFASREVATGMPSWYDARYFLSRIKLQEKSSTSQRLRDLCGAVFESNHVVIRALWGFYLSDLPCKELCRKYPCDTEWTGAVTTLRRHSVWHRKLLTDSSLTSWKQASSINPFHPIRC